MTNATTAPDNAPANTAESPAVQERASPVEVNLALHYIRGKHPLVLEAAFQFARAEIANMALRQVAQANVESTDLPSDEAGGVGKSARTAGKSGKVRETRTSGKARDV